MINSRTIFATAVLAASVGLPAAVQAEILVNSWEPFLAIVGQDPDAPCGNAEYFLVEGMSHVKISNLPNGATAYHVNAMGTFTPIGSEEGAIFRQNVSEVIPIFEKNVVYNAGETIKIIGRPNGNNYRSNINFHLTDVGGEIKSSVDIDRVSCW
jgi:hypothetical protein